MNLHLQNANLSVICIMQIGFCILIIAICRLITPICIRKRRGEESRGRREEKS